MAMSDSHNTRRHAESSAESLSLPVSVWCLSCVYSLESADSTAQQVWSDEYLLRVMNWAKVGHTVGPTALLQSGCAAFLIHNIWNGPHTPTKTWGNGAIILHVDTSEWCSAVQNGVGSCEAC